MLQMATEEKQNVDFLISINPCLPLERDGNRKPSRFNEPGLKCLNNALTSDANNEQTLEFFLVGKRYCHLYLDSFPEDEPLHLMRSALGL